MKYLLLSLFAINVGVLQAQKDIKLSYDHESLLVSDIERSARFYHGILHLDEIENPLNSADRKWFSLGGPYQLHLIHEDRPVVQNDVATHFALHVNDFDAFLEFLEEREVPYTNWPTDAKEVSTRPDGVRQVYVKDPDGYWIEINDAQY